MSEYQAAHSFDPSDVLLYILAFFCPPLPVILRVGFWNNQLLMNVLLTLLFGIPGTLHAIYIVYVTSPITGNPARRVQLGSEPDYERIVESNGMTNPESLAEAAETESSSYGAPPPYSSKQATALTDNKVQTP